MKKIILLFMMIMFSKSVLSHDLNLLTQKIFDLDDSKIHEVIKKSESGDEMASLLLGYIYYDGVVVEKNKDLSIRYLGRVMINKNLLSWKYLIIAFWEMDKDEYDNAYVRKFLKKSASLDNSLAELQLAIELTVLDDENDKAGLLLDKSINNEKMGKLFVEYAAIFYGFNKLKHKKILELKENLSRLKSILDSSGLPLKYLLYKVFIISGLLPKEKKNLGAYDLLSKDIDVYNQKFEKIPLKTKERANEVLNKILKYNKSASSIYRYCENYIGSTRNKCLRVVSLVSNECEVIEPFKNILINYKTSKYFNRCKDVKFQQYLDVIKEW